MLYDNNALTFARHLAHLAPDHYAHNGDQVYEVRGTIFRLMWDLENGLKDAHTAARRVAAGANEYIERIAERGAYHASTINITTAALDLEQAHAKVRAAAETLERVAMLTMRERTLAFIEYTQPAVDQEEIAAATARAVAAWEADQARRAEIAARTAARKAERNRGR